MSTIKNTLYLVASLLFSIPAYAQTDTAKKEIQTAQEQAIAALVHGPSTIRLKDHANFSLPKGDGFIPPEQAIPYLRSVGNTVDEKSFLGLIVPTDGNANWFALLALQQDGYVRDDDARDWKADDMLTSLKTATESDNAARKERGLPELEVGRWAEQPYYDTATHRLYWSAIVRNKQQAADDIDFVNYRTIALARDGFLSLTMVTPLSRLAQDKPTANALLADIRLDDGKRYEDFSASTDRIAEYGLGALIVGVAAKKLGLLAIVLAFAAKFLKVGLLAVAAFGVALKKFFKRKPKAIPQPPAQVTAPTVEKPLLVTEGTDQQEPEHTNITGQR